MSYDGIFYYNSCFFYIFFCYGINHAVPLFPDKIINAYPSFHPFFRISTYNSIVFWLIFLPCICFVLYTSKRLVTFLDVYKRQVLLFDNPNESMFMKHLFRKPTTPLTRRQKIQTTVVMIMVIPFYNLYFFIFFIKSTNIFQNNICIF